MGFDTGTATFKTTVGGLCLPLAWYKRYQFSAAQYRAQVCPDLLLIGVDVLGGFNATVRVNLAGRGLANGGACGTDTYVSRLVFPEVPDGSTAFNDVVMVDVWQAYRDGIWTSSTTVEIALSSISGSARTLIVQPRNNSAIAVTKSVTPQVTGFCPSTIKATVTVNDDGTISIA